MKGVAEFYKFKNKLLQGGQYYEEMILICNILEPLILELSDADAYWKGTFADAVKELVYIYIQELKQTTYKRGDIAVEMGPKLSILEEKIKDKYDEYGFFGSIFCDPELI